MSVANTRVQATRWLIRNQTAKNLEHHWAAFEAWLIADPDHWAVYESEERRWAALESLRSRALQDKNRARETPILAEEGKRRGAKRVIRIIAVSSCCAGLLITAAWLGLGWMRVEAHSWVTYQRGGEQLTPVSLQDGSVVQLNTHSQVRVRLTETAREVALDDGEAYFDVSPSLMRPFDVEAGSTIVRAKGTAFTVTKKQGGQVEAAVTRGSVELEPADESRAAGGKAETQPPEIKAGQVAIIGPSGGVSVDQVDSAELAHRLAWANPLIHFDGMTLSEAVALFNRYNARKLEISGAALGQTRISGRYRLTEPDKFVEALQRLGIGHVIMGAESSPDVRIVLVQK